MFTDDDGGGAGETGLLEEGQRGGMEEGEAGGEEELGEEVMFVQDFSFSVRSTEEEFSGG